MGHRDPQHSLSRYERVKQILNDAQGPNIPDYQGWGAFWNLPLEEFLEVELYGQRMIAAGPDGNGGSNGSSGGCSDCGCETSSEPDCWPNYGPEPNRRGDTSRSDQSGLIVGLRGQAPFDGSIFPKLLWQAERDVTLSEIEEIADWIDAGCPETDERQKNVTITESQQPAKKPATLLRSTVRALANGHARHTISRKLPNQVQRDVSGLHVRKEISSMTEQETKKLREAIACMHEYNGYYQDERSWDYWARVHAANCQHGWEQFLPWHRAYLYHFEQLLQDYDRDITLPYWEWSAYAEQNRFTPTNKLDAGVIPEAYRCWITQKAVDRLRSNGFISREEEARLRAIVGRTFDSGLRFLSAAQIKYEDELMPQPDTLPQPDFQYSPKLKAIYDELWRINPLWHRQRWPGFADKPYRYPTPEEIENALRINDFHEFGSGPAEFPYYGAVESIHNKMHNFGGGKNPHFKGANTQSVDNPMFGDMFDARVTAFDPIFWGHHSNVDRLWAVWQKRHPGVNPDELGEVLAPWNFTVNDMLKIHKLGYEYIKDSYFYPTNNEMSMVRFNARPAGVRRRVLNTFKKAEIRLHRVQKARYNGIIRLFLNHEQADAHSDTENNEHYVGEFTTFGGTCIGGPRHCDVPLPRNRRFDRRSLHHNEPRNIRFDVTDAVRRMMAKRETDISVHLVVTDFDGTPRDGALFMDGVSLNFMD